MIDKHFRDLYLHPVFGRSMNMVLVEKNMDNYAANHVYDILQNTRRYGNVRCLRFREDNGSDGRGPLTGVVTTNESKVWYAGEIERTISRLSFAKNFCGELAAWNENKEALLTQLGNLSRKIEVPKGDGAGVMMAHYKMTVSGKDLGPDDLSIDLGLTLHNMYKCLVDVEFRLICSQQGLTAA